MCVWFFFLCLGHFSSCWVADSGHDMGVCGQSYMLGHFSGYAWEACSLLFVLKGKGGEVDGWGGEG